MGISLEMLDRLRQDGLLNGSVLDIGSSNLYSASEADLRRFISSYGKQAGDAFVDQLARGSAYDPVKGGANGAWVGELLEYCGLNYLAFDIANGYHTRIFDLNQDGLRQPERGAFDLVLNFGTTEHVLNQLNCFRVIHEATCVGGVMVHQLPAAGFTDHGYFLYTGRMFFDLGGHNEYEMLQFGTHSSNDDADLLASARSYQIYFSALKDAAHAPPIRVPNHAMTVIFRKVKDKPFTTSFETSTSVEREKERRRTMTTYEQWFHAGNRSYR